MLKFVTSTTAFLGLALAQGNGNNNNADDQDWYADCEDDNAYYVQTMGSSGQFAYKRCDDNDWLKIKISRLQEIEADGSTVNNKITSFTNGVWSSDGDDGSYVNYTIVDGDVTFSFYTRVLTEAEEFDWGTGEANELKWGFTISGWNFQDSSNQLQCTFNFDAKGGSNDDEDGADETTTAAPEEGARRRLQLDTTSAPFATVEWMLDGYPITAPTEATVYLADGSDEVVDVNVTQETKGKKATFIVTLPSFAQDSKLDYDPLVGERSQSSGVGSASMIAAVFFAIVALIY